MSRTVLVTGIGGFVGQRLAPVLEAAGWRVRGVGRADIGDLSGDVDWRPFLRGAEAVVHLAARVHNITEDPSTADTILAHERANRDATNNLAEQAAAVGIARFVFLSSVKVHGEKSETPLSAASPLAPTDPYAGAKADAEKFLSALSGKMRVTILRPPLVYGPNVKGNFLKLIEVIERGLPLPLGGLQNRRSLIFVDNLADAIRAALDTEPGIYLPSDGEPVSTTRLIQSLAEILGKPARLFPFPAPLLRLAGRVTGKSASIQRLVDSLVVDGALPGWTPPFSLEQGLEEIAAWRTSEKQG